MKKLFLSVAAAFVLLAGCGGGGGSQGAPLPFPPMAMPQPAPEPVKPPVCTVALFGDSVMHGGYEIFNRLEIPPQLNLQRQLPKYTVNDYSQNGGNAFMYMPVFLGHALQEEILVLQFGINDMGSNFPYEQSMSQMLDRAKSLNKRVIITGIVASANHFAAYKEYNDMAKSLAERYGATWAGWDVVEYNKGDAPDGLHPGQEYSTRLVQKLSATITQLAPECQ